jgi:S-adenosylmethionine:tRNA-ribosyltransferase-isomerase (queuine synthetase)
MEAQEAIKRIKIALGMEKPEQEFKEAKLADGVTIVTWEGELEGAELMIVSEEGKIPAPDGDHTLESGEIVTVADGKVIAITAKEEEEEEEAEVEIELKEEKKEYDMEAINTMLKECMAKIEVLEKKMGEVKLEEKIEEAMSAISAQKEAFTSLVEVVDKIAKSPSDEPVDNGNLFSSMKVSKELEAEKFNDFAQAIKNLKNK